MGWIRPAPRNGARIALCIVAGISMLCCGGVLALGALVPDSADQNAFVNELDRLQELTAPAWTNVTGIISSVLMAVAPPVALILLVIPPSNRFFRKPAPTGPFGGYGQPYPGYYYVYPDSPSRPSPVHRAERRGLETPEVVERELRAGSACFSADPAGWGDWWRCPVVSRASGLSVRSAAACRVAPDLVGRLGGCGMPGRARPLYLRTTAAAPRGVAGRARTAACGVNERAVRRCSAASVSAGSGRRTVID